MVEPTAAFQAFVQLEEKSRAAASVRELLFSLANETWQLIGHRQSFIWDNVRGTKPRLRVISGVAQLGEDSPFTVWLKRLGVWLNEEFKKKPDARYIGEEDLPKKMRDGWREWMPSYLFVAHINLQKSGRTALAAFALEEGMSDLQADLAQRLMDTYGHSWAALENQQRAGKSFASLGATAFGSGSLVRRLFWPVFFLAAAAALFIPMRLSVLATGEIIALDASVISAPLDGVVKTFHVQPNQMVNKNDLLFTLDETSLKSRREIALKQLQVARADAMAAQQKAFESENSRADLASLNGRVAERAAELSAVEDQFKRLEVVSPAAGVVVFGDINDWLGKPVSTGERVALLADPKDAGVLIWLPVSEAINLEPGAEVKLYLQVSPLKPLTATITQTSYQAVLSPEGISAYRLKAKLSLANAEETTLARIGLKGTAKLYGQKAALGYYLFRRPIASLRELTGL